jgi:hypothetical protein
MKVATVVLAILSVGAEAWAAPFPTDDGIRSRLRDLAAAAASRGLQAKVVEIGRSTQARPIEALVVGASRSRVLYLGLHHAREWLSADLVLRLAAVLVRGAEPRAARLAREREAWLVPVVNPDGYARTFLPGERHWRKNARDNDGDGLLGPADGVDLNRNYDFRWAGSLRARNDPLSPEYRGPAPFSEPETRAVRDLVLARRFAFAVSYHAFGSYLVYPEGRSAVGEEPVDAPLFRALAGDSRTPAIVSSLRRDGSGPERYRVTHGNPEVGGRFDAWAYHRARVPSFYVELHDGFGFEFPEDESGRERVLRDNLPFALDLLESASRPGEPVSHLGHSAPAIEHRPPRLSYGERPLLEVTARRDLRELALFFAGPGGSGWVPLAPLEMGVHYARWGAFAPHPEAELRYFFAARGARLPAQGVFALRRAGPGGGRLVVTSMQDRWRGLLARAGEPAEIWGAPHAPDPGAALGAFREVVLDASGLGTAALATMLRALEHQTGNIVLLGVRALGDRGKRSPGRRLARAPGAPRPRYRRQVEIAYLRGDPSSPEYLERALRALAGARVGASGLHPLPGAEVAVVRSGERRPPFRCTRCWLSGRADDTLAWLSLTLDLSRAKRAVLELNARWDLEPDNDGLIVESRRAGGRWAFLADEGGRAASDLGLSGREREARLAWLRLRAPALASVPWRALTGRGSGVLRFDLSRFAGGPAEVRFSYLADPHRHGRGVAVERVSVPEIGFAADASSPGWTTGTAFGPGAWRTVSDDAWRPAAVVRRGRLTVGWLSPFELAPGERLAYLRLILAAQRDAAPPEVKDAGALSR